MFADTADGMLSAFRTVVTDMYLPWSPCMADYFPSHQFAMVQMGLTTGASDWRWGRLFIPLSDVVQQASVNYWFDAIIIYRVHAVFLSFAPDIYSFVTAVDITKL